MRRWIVLVCLLLLAGPALAQQSANFQIEEHAFNAGGTPSPVDLVSPNFSVTLASIGDSVVATGLGSPSFEIDVGFDVAYLPPGEVAGTCGGPGEGCLRFSDVQTLSWPAEASAGRYNLYRDDTSDGYGNCEQADLAVATTTDPSTPTSGNTFYYLVTVKNRLAEEGTKGFQSNPTVERLGSTCP